MDVAARAGHQPVFLYTLPASIGDSSNPHLSLQSSSLYCLHVQPPCHLSAPPGTSPHPYHWPHFLAKYGASLSSCPPNMACVKEVWETWWLHYCQVGPWR